MPRAPLLSEDQLMATGMTDQYEEVVEVATATTDEREEVGDLGGDRCQLA